MIKLVQPNPILLNGNQHGVLLLHSYTSTLRDMKLLAVYLNDHEFTCYTPAYQGHGLKVQDFIKYGPKDWWNDVIQGYQILRDSGCKQISVIGISLGAVMSLKMAEEFDIHRCITMSAPQGREKKDIFKRLVNYADYMNKLENHTNNDFENNITKLESAADQQISDFHLFIQHTLSKIDTIKCPIALLYGKKDEPLYKTSAEYIYVHVRSKNKLLKEYTNSGHLMTLSPDQQELHQDVLNFLLSNT